MIVNSLKSSSSPILKLCSVQYIQFHMFEGPSYITRTVQEVLCCGFSSSSYSEFEAFNHVDKPITQVFSSHCPSRKKNHLFFKKNIPLFLLYLRCPWRLITWSLKQQKQIKIHKFNLKNHSHGKINKIRKSKWGNQRKRKK